MNTEELKLYIPKRLKNRIVLMANERKLSINKMSNYLLEIAIYKLYIIHHKKESVASSVRCLVSLYTIILSQLFSKVNDFMVFCYDN